TAPTAVPYGGPSLVSVSVRVCVARLRRSFAFAFASASDTKVAARVEESGEVGKLLGASSFEDERIGDDDDTAALRLRELPAPHRLRNALLDVRIIHRRVLHHRRNDLTSAADRKLDHHAPIQVLLMHQLLLVAEPHLIQVTADDAPNDFLIQRATHLSRTG